MSDEIGIIHASATGIIGCFTTVLGFFGMRLIKQVDANTKDLAEHKLEDVSTYVTNDQLDRVHDRIDSADKKLDDIKTLLITMKNQ